jgi:hypothetical protein
MFRIFWKALANLQYFVLTALSLGVVVASKGEVGKSCSPTVKSGRHIKYLDTGAGIFQNLWEPPQNP